MDLFTDKNTCLWASKEFITTECDNIDASGNCFLHCRFFGQSIFAQVDKTAGAEIFHDHNIICFSQLHQVGIGHLVGETDDFIVTTVHPEQYCCVIGNGIFVVLEMGAIRRPHFHKSCAASSHDIGNTKRTANLHQLATRNNHFFSGPKRFQGEKNCSGIVIHH